MDCSKTHAFENIFTLLFRFQCTTNVSRTYIQASELGLALMLILTLLIPGVAEGAQTWGGALLNFYLQSSLGGASRHLARTRS